MRKKRGERRGERDLILFYGVWVKCSGLRVSVMYGKVAHSFFFKLYKERGHRLSVDLLIKYGVTEYWQFYIKMK